VTGTINSSKYIRHINILSTKKAADGHLNNARYGDICCDVLSLLEWDGTELKRFRITYLQEAKFGDELIIYRSKVTDDGVYVRGQNSDTVFFEACLELKIINM